jgi:HSP20 family molecular chaperone IbpA
MRVIQHPPAIPCKTGHVDPSPIPLRPVPAAGAATANRRRSSIDVKATDRSLVISAERQAPEAAADAEGADPLLSEFRYGTWSRSFRFPSGIEREGITAQYRDGLLTVTAPKAQTMTSVTVKVES